MAIIAWVAKLGASGYFLYRVKTKKEHRGGNGFGAGLFLALFLADAGRFVAPWVQRWFT